jgi:putative transposase
MARAALCHEFSKTGHKLISRYSDSVLEGTTDRSRRPYLHANQLPFHIEMLIVRTKQDKPNWGAPKFRKRLAPFRRSQPCMPSSAAWPFQARHAAAQQG